MLGRTMLPGRDLERPERWNGDEKRRLCFFSSFTLSVLSNERRPRVSKSDAVLPMSDGSSDASRDDDGSDSEAYITINTSTHHEVDHMVTERLYWP
jgi:hypothetical protein